MNRMRWKTESILYAAAFGVALVLRMAGAGRLPLDNAEAALALQALALSRGQPVLLDPYPAYLALTTVWFFLLDASSWAARFWPALAGSLLVLVPALYRRMLGRLPAVILAFLLAFDPGLLAVSRQAGSLALAMMLLLLAVGLWLRKRTALAGAAAGLALLSGPDLWLGVISLGAALWISGAWARVQPADAAVIASEEERALILAQESPAEEPRRLSLALKVALATAFFAGTLFFTIPSGLSAMAGSIPAYLNGWTVPSGIPALRLITALLAYEFLALLAGLVGGVRGVLKHDPTDRLLLVWWAVALLLVLVYPGRQVSSLAWSLLPLLGLAARQIARLVDIPAYNRLPTLGQALLAAVLLAFISISLASLSSPVQASNQALYWIRTGGALVMLLASAALIGWGWSPPVAVKGLALGGLLILGVYSISAAWNAAGHSGRVGVELWSGQPVFTGGDLLVDTIEDLHLMRLPEAGDLDLAVVDVTQPALDWALRDFHKVHHTSLLSSNARPALVITQPVPELSLSAAYRGQDFTVAQVSNWNTLSVLDWWRWIITRSLPATAVQRGQVILWARTDLFPGEEEQAQSQDIPQP